MRSLRTFFFTSILFVFFLNSGFGQANINWHAIKPDTLRIDSMVTIAGEMRDEGRTEEAIGLFRMALLQAKGIGDAYRKADIGYYLGSAWWRLKRADSALAYLLPALELSGEKAFTDVYPYVFSRLLNIYVEERKDQEALDLVNAMEQVAPRLSAPADQLMCYGNAGVFFSNKGLRQRGLEYYLKGYEFVKNSGDSASRYTMLINIASTFSTLQNEEKAREYIREASAVLPASNPVLQAAFQLSVGSIDDRFKRYDSAEIRLRKAVELARKAQRPYETGFAMANLGKVLGAIGKYREALDTLEKAISIGRQIGAKIVVQKAWESKGGIQLKMGDYNGAAETLANAYREVKLSNDLSTLEDVTRNLTEAYEKTGALNKGLAMQKEYASIRDSIIGVQTLFSTAEAEARFQNQLLREQAMVKDLKISNQARAMVILGLLAMAIGGAGFFYNYRTRTRKQLETAQMRTKIATDLHDEVGSTLSSIGMMTDVLAFRLKGADEKTIHTLQTISRNARQTLESMDEIIWTINPRQDAFANLETRLKQFAYPLLEGKNIVGHFEFDSLLESARLRMEQRQHIYLVLKEAVNNAVKYSDAKELKVTGTVTGDQLFFEVSDNGKGFEYGLIGQQRNGLTNMQKRAKALGGKLTLLTGPGKGTLVQLEVPVK